MPGPLFWLNVTGFQNFPAVLPLALLLPASAQDHSTRIFELFTGRYHCGGRWTEFHFKIVPVTGPRGMDEPGGGVTGALMFFFHRSIASTGVAGDHSGATVADPGSSKPKSVRDVAHRSDRVYETLQRGNDARRPGQVGFGSGAILTGEMRAAQARLTNQRQAVNVAMRTRDYAAGEQSLRVMEDTLATIGNFLAKAAKQ